MSGGGRLRRLLRIPLPPRQQAAADLGDEFSLHLELRARELEREGLSREEAEREALRLFGDPEAARREMLRAATAHVREQRRREAARDMFRDIRYAGRSLIRSPGFTVVAVLTLALGIGANTAIFSVVDAVLLEPLPVADPSRVAMIWESFERGERSEDRNVVSPANVNDWRERSRTFERIAAFWTIPGTVLSSGGAREVPVQVVHPDFFEVLGVPPRLGRTFAPEEGDWPSAVAVLSHGFWRDHFGGDPDVVGATIELVGTRLEVVGVMGPELEFLAPGVAFWRPNDFTGWTRQNSGRFARAVGRLAPGATMESAQAEMVRIAADLREEHPDFNDGFSANVVPLDEQVKGDVRPALLVLLGAVAVLLLITCVNVANLLLVRAASRRTEIAVRASLGAGRGRIIRELLTESLLVAGLGGLVGVGVAYLSTRLLAVAVPPSLQVPRLDQTSVDLEVLGFAGAAALVTGVLFGLAPAFDAFRTDLIAQLREGGRGSAGARSARRLRSAIVIGEVALSLMLLIGGGLLLRSFIELQREDLGIRPENVLTARISMPGSRYQTGEARAAFLSEVTASIAALPEVTAAGAIAWLPLSGDLSATAFHLPDRPKPPVREMPSTEVQAVEGDIFRALGTPLLQGRLFTPADAPGTTPVAIVNRAFAEQIWPGENPIGKRFILPWGEDRLLEVVGVVGNIRHRGVETEPQPGAFMPYRQFPSFGSSSIVARTAGDETAVAAGIVRRIRELDPNIAVADLAPLSDVVADAIARPRTTSLIVGLFAALALLLAALGIYGVLAYAVSLRSQELSIRQALGARAADVARLVLREAVLLTVAGIAIGVLVALAATRLLSDQLYQVSPRDPAVFLGMSGLILVIAIVAGAVPAIRAARVDPGSAMRDE